MNQGSNEWHKARSVRITCSKFGDILANPNTKRYKDYLEDIVNSILGVPRFEDDKPWFNHGKEMEPEAIGMYEWETGVEILASGLTYHPFYNFIAGSTDGDINSDAGIEVKSRKSLKEYLKAENKLPSNHKPQVYGYIWIKGWKWCDFVNYYKNENTGKTLFSKIRIMPDKEYQEKLERACLHFWWVVQEEVEEKKYIWDSGFIL